MIIKEKAKIIRKNDRGGGIFDIAVKSSISGYAKAGQFVNFYLAGTEHMLPRPLSICEILGKEDALRIVFRVAGKGTGMIASLSENDEIEIMGPLGNGYPEDPASYGRVILAGGGIGIPPLLQCAKDLKDKGADFVSCLGIKGKDSGESFLIGEFRKYGDVYVSSDDGSAGIKGNVTDLLREYGTDSGVILACGPKVMLKAVKEYSEINGIKCFISLEERMACGIGACLGCVCDTVNEHPHFNVKKARVCKDGPVFDAAEVVFR